MRRSQFTSTLAVAVLLPLAAVAQDVTAPALKAGYVYNFVRFTEWPAPLPPADPFVLCVIGDDAVSDALERVVKGREVAGHRMVVSRIPVSAPKASCRVLYVTGRSPGEVVQEVAGLQDSPVLTISDVVGFTDGGGMAQLFFERGQLRFNISIESVKRSHLRMSSRLLALAKR
jgi:hypothetical protein